MGIPKFFRYISERYPLTSQLIQENKIPEFDNLYLDFNGIIHNCSHPNDVDAHFRVSEEQIFTSIFTYVDHLFGKIRPKKLFFMAVDGVAPRAKMNQQRSRRFRTAKEAKEAREKAERKGEKLPTEKAFDSNCITPGTSFMARLSEQLQYFINKKITEDSNWRGIQVVLSGHEVPGEGEHKIMEYIRLARAQPDYNPNVRHCLYGLDADLFMLGLLSHDPHFCLMREEVKFGPSSRKKGNTSLESINFYLLHLSLLREYLDLEFHEIEHVLPFEYNLERVIDDFILLAVFVGNDFLPNLPDLHIHQNGLERLFEVYKKVLPTLDGYINESGTINTKRLQSILDEMTLWEREIFEKEYGDMNWYKGKQEKHVKEMELARKRSKLVLTKPQREIFHDVKAFVLDNRGRPFNPASHPTLTMPNDFSARERGFIERLAAELHLVLTWDEYDEEDVNVLTWRLPEAIEQHSALNGVADENANGDEDEWEDEDDEESRAAVDRILHKYEKAQVDEDEDFDARHEQSMKQKMDEWKREYYKSKLEISYHDPKAMGDLIYRYVEGLQWVMYYYTSGVASWSWFYDYHYAPRISDLQNVDQMTFNFDLGKPFKPFQQLMGVLPVASMDFIPIAYQDLMYDPSSFILDFYPVDFEQDLNGKKQEWEAIVKIPFIDEERLLHAMAARDHRLTDEEKQRNSFGTSIKFSYNPGEPTYYPSSLAGFFPPLYRCQCIMETFDLPTLDGLHLIPGLRDGVCLGAEALAGFPSIQTLSHTATLAFHGVNVHGSESRNKSMVVHIQNPHEGRMTQEIAEEMVGQRTFMGWPFLQEGLVVAVSDSLFKYEKMAIVDGAPKKVISNPHSPQGLNQWKAKADKIEQVYSKRLGVITGEIEVLLHVRPLKGLKRLETGALVKDYYEGQETEIEQAVQMCLSNVASEDPRFMEKEAPPLSEEFPEGTKLFFLGEHAYGVAAQVSATNETSLSVVLAIYPSDKLEIEKFKTIVDNKVSARHWPSFKVAEMLGISGRALSKITSSFMVIGNDGQKTNLGLSLKFEAKALKVVNYSRKNGRHWEFSEKAVNLIREYKTAFPELFESLDGNGDAMVRVDDIFGEHDPLRRIREIQSWLKNKGVKDFEPVSLFCDQLSKETVAELETLANDFNANRTSAGIKKAIVKGIPRQAVLKPSHAIYRLQSQRFALGDRVIMVQDSGGVPLSVKGVVIGLNPKSMDVVWDVPFMSGVTLGDRCSQYRGSAVPFNSCLNLTDPQFTVWTSPKPQQPFKPRFGAYPEVKPPPGQRPAAGFRPHVGAGQQATVQIMTNPNRATRGGYANHDGPSAIYHHTTPSERPPSAAAARSAASPSTQADGTHFNTPYGHGRGTPYRGRGQGPHPPRGGRGFLPHIQSERGRGVPLRGGMRGVYRGRGRGSGL